MSMIPAIAGYFGIAIDVLFEYDVNQIKENVQKIVDDAWKYFFDDTRRYIETMKAALKDYPGNEVLMEQLVEAYRSSNTDNQYFDEISDLCQTLLSVSNDFPRVCRMKGVQAQIYLTKGEYEKAKALLETLPEWLVPVKYDSIARILKGKDRVNGASMAKCIYMENAYQMCMIDGDGWFHMEEEGVTFQTVPVNEYIDIALICYKQGRDIIEAFVGDDPINQHSYVWKGMQTFHWSFYQAIAGCYKKLGNIEECEKAIDEAYHIISVAWDDFEENKKLYMDPFYQYLKDYDLAEYIR